MMSAVDEHPQRAAVAYRNSELELEESTALRNAQLELWLVSAIRSTHARRQPVLIGTIMVVVIGLFAALYAGVGTPAIVLAFVVVMVAGGISHWEIRRLRSRATARGLPRDALDRFDRALRGEEVGAYSIDQWYEDADTRVSLLRDRAGLTTAVHSGGELEAGESQSVAHDPTASD